MTKDNYSLITEARSETCYKRYNAREAKSLALELAEALEKSEIQRAELLTQLRRYQEKTEDSGTEDDTPTQKYPGGSSQGGAIVIHEVLRPKLYKLGDLEISDKTKMMLR